MGYILKKMFPWEFFIFFNEWAKIKDKHHKRIPDFLKVERINYGKIFNIEPSICRILQEQGNLYELYQS